MERYVSITKAAQMLGVSITTLRRWEEAGKLCAAHTAGGHRRYDLANLRPDMFDTLEKKQRVTLAYARVSDVGQSDELVEQIHMLDEFCTNQGWIYEVISDQGSGINCQKQGLQKLVKAIIEGSVARLVLVRKDRLLRLGAELVFTMCEVKNVEVVVLNESLQTLIEDDFINDVHEIFTVFNARCYGAKSIKNQRLLDAMQACVARAQTG